VRSFRGSTAGTPKTMGGVGFRYFTPNLWSHQSDVGQQVLSLRGGKVGGGVLLVKIVIVEGGIHNL